MKSLQESILDDEIINNTSLESVLAESFPRPDEVECEALSNNYYWMLNKNILERIVPRTHIDCIRVSWTNDKSDPDKDIYVYLFDSNRGQHAPMTKFVIKSGTGDLRELMRISYSIMELLRDNIRNIKKLMKYCSRSIPKLYKIDLFDILK